MKKATNTTVAKGQVSPKRTEDEFFLLLYFICDKSGKRTAAEMLVKLRRPIDWKLHLWYVHDTKPKIENGYFVIYT